MFKISGNSGNKVKITREKTIEEKLGKAVTAVGGLARKFVSPGFTGVPDRIVLLPGGRIYFVELKAKGRKPSPRQKLVIPQLRRLGFQVWIIDRDATLELFIDEITKNYEK